MRPERRRLLWVHRTVDADPGSAWSLFSDLDRWPDWGPSVRGATLDTPGRFEAGATGRVRTALGPSLPFRLTEVDEGRCWSWSVAGIPATVHRVDQVGGPDGPTRIGFGVPWLAAPYLAVCRVALHRMGGLLTSTRRRS